MTIVDQQGEQEKLQAEAIIAATTPFDGVESVHVELFEDHTGDPSLMVAFRLRQGFRPNRDWVKAFTDYDTKLCIELLQSGLTRFPYSRIDEAA